MEGKELLSCPLCGGDHIVSGCQLSYGPNGEEIESYRYYCFDCASKHYQTEEQAVEAWNRRASVTAERVRDAVLDNFEETHETNYDVWETSKFDWQAIADELNGVIGTDEA